MSTLSLFHRRDPWWEADGRAASRARHRHMFVSGVAFLASVGAVAAAAFAWSIQLGVAAALGIHATLPLG